MLEQKWIHKAQKEEHSSYSVKQANDRAIKKG